MYKERIDGKLKTKHLTSLGQQYLYTNTCILQDALKQFDIIEQIGQDQEIEKNIDQKKK